MGKSVTKKRGVNDITPERRAQLNTGVVACTDLIASLVIDFATLMHERLGEAGFERLRTHTSDTVRTCTPFMSVTMR